MNRSPAPVITITTDFGTSDGYLAAMKGAVLNACPQARLIDITHDIPPYDVMEAAFVLRQAAPYYPPGTIHLVVVDPGVGSDRLGVALRHQEHFYVGPDNGLFALVLETAEPDELVVLDSTNITPGTPTSRTFHGRDIFGPSAARLACGVALSDLGSPACEMRSLHWAIPIDDTHGIRGWVVHVDHFGNCITNISRRIFERRAAGRLAKCYVGNSILRGLHGTYSDVAAGEPLMLFGSGDVLEVAVSQGNAAGLMHIQRGMPVNIVFMDAIEAPATES